MSLLIAALPGVRSVARTGHGAGVSVALPVAKKGEGIRRWIGDQRAALAGAAELRAEAEHLREELARLHTENAMLRAEHSELLAVTQMIARRPHEAPHVIAVPVVTALREGRSLRLWISGGVDVGLTPGLVVLGPGGVIGTVREVYAGHAVIQLLVDEGARFGGEVTERGEIGIVAGVGKPGFLELRLETTTTRIEPGDTVVTSGQRGSLIPAGVPIGVVTEVSVNEAGELRAVIEPADDGLVLRTVFVLDARQTPWEMPTR